MIISKADSSLFCLRVTLSTWQHLLLSVFKHNVECSITIAAVMRSCHWIRMSCNPSIPGVCRREKGSGHSRTAGHRCSPSWRYTLTLSASLSIFDSSWALKGEERPRRKDHEKGISHLWVCADSSHGLITSILLLSMPSRAISLSMQKRDARCSRWVPDFCQRCSNTGHMNTRVSAH